MGLPIPLFLGNVDMNSQPHQRRDDPCLLLSIVVINYNSSRQLKECVDALLLDTADLKAEVIIVDNASSDESTDFMAEPGYEGLTLMRNSQPMGYGYAANQGFHASRGEYVLFSNTDMVVHEGTVHKMLGHMDEDPLLGAVAGYYLRPDGSFDRFYNTFPDLISIFASFFPKALQLRLRAYRRYYMLDVPFDRETEVEQPSGSFFLIRKNLYKDDYISPEFNMYFTDVDACRKIYLAGRKIKVFKDCPVSHNHNVKSRFVMVERDNYLYVLDYFTGMVNYFLKYHGRLKWLQAKCFISAFLAGNIVYEPLKMLLSGQGVFKVIKYRLLLFLLFVMGRNKMKEERDRIARSNELVVAITQGKRTDE